MTTLLQLLTFVVTATYLIHRGSPESRDGDDEMAEDIKTIPPKTGGTTQRILSAGFARDTTGYQGETL